MEQIGNMIAMQRSEPSKQQASLQDLQLRMTLTRRYGDREHFLTTFNPDMQRQLCQDADKCIFGDFPTFGMLKTAYGNNAPVMWLIPQLVRLSDYCGCKDKLQGKPLEECAAVIASEFYFLKISEMMLFLFRFKSGRYGRFYGSVDPLVITTSLREFLKERMVAIEKHEQEELRHKEEEERKKRMTWDEYCMMKYGEIRQHPILNPNTPQPKKEKPKENTEDVINIAKSLLSDPLADENTKAIYSKVFKRKYGHTPQEYIEKHQIKKTDETS